MFLGRILNIIQIVEDYIKLLWVLCGCGSMLHNFIILFDVL